MVLHLALLIKQTVSLFYKFHFVFRVNLLFIFRRECLTPSMDRVLPRVLHLGGSPVVGHDLLLKVHDPRLGIL